MKKERSERNLYFALKPFSEATVVFKDAKLSFLATLC